ncbi:MAG: sulfatase-like hydrolase/transferase [Lentisphaerae bacterium]|nr:sulfatase-like hydrolase/transferase [Lentisphaerota bacterium]MBT4821902.1 sulfatase-like hydrolase/transferase [Lentisphaerota bacterium]MBT5609993.1 sulfatase-like hydrolase/transferase [Lentisphaerota bacterium]MBT7059116.1 sulfatase-like hydrolase/transferase [Lentisphaerota bacterium]MBT7841438.1 sulfatase-like hydrolase/transferase [Lentisphaerota bacterium]
MPGTGTRRPNILWLMTDEQRTDTMGAYGSPWGQTPNLDRLADEGVRFNAAYTPSPVCISARACLLTGLAASTTGVLSNHHILPDQAPPFLTREFTRAGYQMASFGKHHYASQRKAFDLEGGIHVGPKVGCCNYNVEIDPEEYGVVQYETGAVWEWLFAGRYPGTVEDTPEYQNVQQCLEWLRRRDPNRPFFLRASFLAPHTPVVTPSPYDTMVDPATIGIPMDRPGAIPGVPDVVAEHLQKHAGSHVLTDEQIRRTRQCYYGYMRCTDHCFGVLTEAMRQMGELENTIIAFVSDHGTHLGDHGFYQKQSFYDASARVPFFFSGQGIAPSATLQTPVNTGSLLPTLMELADLDVPEDTQFASAASAVSTGQEPMAVPVFSEIDYGVWKGYRIGDRYVMIRDGKWKMGLFRDPTAPARLPDDDGLLLHDMEADPGERTNLANAPEFSSIRQDLLAKIDAWDASRPIREPTVRTASMRGA